MRPLLAIALLIGATTRAQTQLQEPEVAAQIQKENAEVYAQALKAKDQPKTQQLIISLSLCWRKDDEQEALDNIKAEKKAARIGGIIDMQILRAHQDYAMAAKAAQERLREKLREIKLKPLPCNHEVVKAFEWMATHDERENLDACRNGPEQCPVDYMIKVKSTWRLLALYELNGKSDRYNWFQNESRRFAKILAGEDD